MKLSLMILNLTTDIFLDKDFTPKKTPDWDGYEKVLKIAHDAGYKAIDLTDMECACFGAQKVKESMEKYDLACGSMILFENFTCTDVKEQKRVQEHTKKAIDHSASLGCHTMMLVAAGTYA